ncbi:glycosyltransferase [Candidatus Pacearchaeota archaeon]|nr:glycosyltransferase [Candidatus Pacearchaeota archaeon]
MLCIIMPAYNEEKRIGRTLEEYSHFFDKLAKQKILEYRILVVINGTTDRTEEVVQKYTDKNKKILSLNFKKGGKGFAILKGFEYAVENHFDEIGFVDSDLATYPEEFWKLVAQLHKYNGAIASRWKKGAVVKRDIRKIIRSRGFNFLVRSLFFLPYQDTQCGAKIFKWNAIKEILPEIKSLEWAFDVDLLYLCKRHKFNIKEIPTKWDDKKGSKIGSIITPIKMASSVIRLRMLYSPFKFIVRIYDKLPNKFKVHNL